VPCTSLGLLCDELRFQHNDERGREKSTVQEKRPQSFRISTGIVTTYGNASAPIATSAARAQLL